MQQLKKQRALEKEMQQQEKPREVLLEGELLDPEREEDKLFFFFILTCI
ncbi:MAG: hypothetical protein YK1309IOTA_680019 [Marine Group I thaumarchaeote]|nr:MAG: hypothetical protein YK1309IOTA_680019 [Marine Group I thaumarchaeote]